MKVNTAFASLSGAGFSASVVTDDPTLLTLVLVLFALRLLLQVAFLVFYVCRPADRKDLRKLLQARREH